MHICFCLTKHIVRCLICPAHKFIPLYIPEYYDYDFVLFFRHGSPGQEICSHVPNLSL